MKEYKVKEINSLARGIDVLDALQSLHAASLHDLYNETKIPKSTLTRILHTLSKKGYVWQRLVDNAFLPSHQFHRTPNETTDEDWLVEIASPLLADLCDRARWPSVLTIPRLDHMEVVEANSPKSYFDDIALGPIGFKLNMLRSASGRAYLAFCPASERESILKRLQTNPSPGHELAYKHEQIFSILESIRKQGYALRATDFGGHYSDTRAKSDDRRNSIALPIEYKEEILGCINITWKNYVLETEHAAKKLLPELQETKIRIEQEIVDKLTSAR